MTVKECYEKMDGNYEDVINRLLKEDRVVKFLKLFLKDDSKEILEQSIRTDNKKEAFRGAHTLKGVAQNLSLDALHIVSSELTELLRDDSRTLESAEIKIKFEELREIYDKCVRMINQL